MKKIFLQASIVTITILLFSCRTGRNFTAQDPDLYKVKTIAILPVKVVFSGNLPNKMTITQMDSLLEKDGYIYQKSLSNNLLSRSGGKNRITGVSYQAVEKTNNLLMKNQMSISKLYSADPDELAKMLGVDAVIKMEINSNRVMSTIASLGLDILNDILIKNNTNFGVLNNANLQNRTADLNTFATLIYNGKTLWNSRYQRQVDWQETTSQVVDEITAAMGRNFPY